MILKHIDRAVTALAVCCLAASTGMIIANVFYRYVVLDWLGAAARQIAWLRPVYEALNDVFGAVSVTAETQVQHFRCRRVVLWNLQD